MGLTSEMRVWGFGRECELKLTVARVVNRATRERKLPVVKELRRV